MTRASPGLLFQIDGRQTGYSWKIVTAIVVTWMVILVCIVVSAYKAEECSVKWHNFQTRMTSAMADVKVLKQQTRELKVTLQELGKMQLLEASLGSPFSERTDMFKKLIVLMQQSPESVEEARPRPPS